MNVQLLLALRQQAAALTQQADILFHQATALHGQIEAMARAATDELVEASGTGVTERIFKPDVRHFMEPNDGQGNEESREHSSRSDAIQIRATRNIGGARHGGSDTRRQRGSAAQAKPQGGVTGQGE